MLANERLLIIEEEFLIALDIQRVLESARARSVVFARNFSEAAELSDRFGEFDLAIVMPPRPTGSDLMVARILADAGPAIVVCSAAALDIDESPLANAVLVGKPFSDDELLAACGRAIARRGVTAP